MAIPEDFVGIVQAAAGNDDPAWPAAVIEVESGWNPYAVGDHGRAVGLFQMHLDFMAWMFPEWATNAAALAAIHGSPFHQAEAFHRFWGRMAHSSVQRRLEIFHYGLSATERRAQAGEETDPDGTVKKYYEAYGEVTGKPAPPGADNPAVTAAAKKAASRKS